MIFVTGGTGMVGAHLLFDLIVKGEKVRALKRKGSNIQQTEKIFSFYSSDYQFLLQKIEWIEGDILDKDGLRKILTGVTRIYHAAAMVSFNLSDKEEMIHNNCQGTANLLDLAMELQIPRFCHVSSIAAIGSPPEGISANEEHPWHTDSNHSAYAESKYLSEMEVWRAIFQGLDAVIVNPSVILGAGDWGKGSSQLFSSVWKGMKFYTKGGTGFVDVRDVSAAMQLLMDDNIWESAKNQRYILNSENLSYRLFFSQVSNGLHLKPPKFLAGKGLLHLAWRMAALKSFFTGSKPSLTRETARSANKLSCYDGSKISRAIGFEYTPVAVSIRKCCELFLRDFGLK